MYTKDTEIFIIILIVYQNQEEISIVCGKMIIIFIDYIWEDVL